MRAERPSTKLLASAGGMEHFEAELRLAAHEAGMEDALVRGPAALRDRRRASETRAAPAVPGGEPARVRLIVTA